MKPRLFPIIQALAAAILFSISAPLSKILLGSIDSLQLAGLLYLGSGIGGLLLSLIQKTGANEARLTRQDLPWMVGAVVSGGVIAPILLLGSLKSTPAATASLLLNFESISTTIIAALIFKEAIGKRIFWAVILVTMASILLSWDFSASWGISFGALGILAACFFWAIDNNLTRKISAKNPLTIVSVKGLVAGSFSFILSLLLHKPLPLLTSALLAMLLGAISYGLSIFLFIHAMRNLGAARTGALFGSAPFVGTVLSVVLLGEMPTPTLLLAFPLMVLGAWLMVSENHEHRHTHNVMQHEHRHSHQDGHHEHGHSIQWDPARSHSHLHEHTPVTHTHLHTPDDHHHHTHKATARS